MRVVFDARMARWTGVGRYIREVLKALSLADRGDEYVVAVNPGDDADFVPKNGMFTTAVFGRTIAPYSLAEQRFLAREVSALRPDVVHFPHFNVPAFGRLRYVVTIHDLIYYHFPGDCPSYIAHVVAKRLIRIAVRNACEVITDSESTKNDIQRTLGADGARITVTHLGAMIIPEADLSPELVAQAARSAGVAGPYILYTGNHSPHKNLGVMLSALAKLNRAGAGLKAVITGKADRHTPGLLDQIALTGTQADVVLPGMVPDRLLFALYKGAEALVFPSLCAGFGLPPLEAFACGTPVVASNTSSIPEVLGDAAVLLNPGDAGGFADAIARIRSDRAFREDLVARGYRRLAMFSWAETASKTAEVYARAFKGA